MSDRNTEMGSPKTAILIGLVGIAIGALAMVIGMRVGWIGTAEQAAVGEEAPLYWVAPMDSNYRRDEPGLSPMGMELIPVFAGDVSDEDLGIRISPAVMQNLGIRTGAVSRGDLQPTIDAVAFVAYDEDSLHSVHTRVAGWVEASSVRAEGDAVTEGQVLFQLYAPELVTVQEEFIAALSTGNSGLIAASRQRMVSRGLSQGDIARIERDRRVMQRIPVVAPATGVVTALAVREGTYLQPATRALMIVDPAAVWIIAELFERQAASVAAGQRVDLTFESLPGEHLSGHVDYIYPEIDARTRSLRVRIRLHSADARLRPNMYAQAQFMVAPLSGVLHLPREAVIRTGSGSRVVLAMGDGRFRSVAVDAGAEVGDRVVIRSGLGDGDAVVTSGQFLIDSESNFDAETLRATEAQAVELEPQPAMRTATVRGVFLGWHDDGERVRIRHDRIPDLGMMGMTMPFRLQTRSIAEGLADGTEIEFELMEMDDRLTVTAMRAVQAPEHQHGGGDQ